MGNRDFEKAVLFSVVTSSVIGVALSACAALVLG